ncbi:MAG: stage II sporulation protein P [Christensenellales bacterium]
MCREVKIKSGRFNQHILTGALLIEIGNNRNTLSEALAACPIIAEALERAHRARN